QSAPLADALRVRFRRQPHPRHLSRCEQPATRLRPKRRSVIAHQKDFRRWNVRSHARNSFEHVHPHLGHVANFDMADRAALTRAVEPRASLMWRNRHVRTERHPVKECRLLGLAKLVAEEWHHVHIARATEGSAALMLEEA